MAKDNFSRMAGGCTLLQDAGHMSTGPQAEAKMCANRQVVFHHIMSFLHSSEITRPIQVDGIPLYGGYSLRGLFPVLTHR